MWKGEEGRGKVESGRLGPVETQAKKILRKYNLIEGRTDFDQPRSGRREVLEVRYKNDGLEW